jgi:glycerol-3-phosphate dehydrogenase
VNPRGTLDALPGRFDAVVVGGGITGAGVALAAAQCGVRVLLVDERDFAGGTSSASSKLVHGGLRYLQHGQLRLTWESVRERQRLLQQLPQLVETQPFLLPIYRGGGLGRASVRAGLWLYDAIAGRFASRWLSAADAVARQPGLRSDGLLGAFEYQDARTDDARLVLRLLGDAVTAGAQLRNYTRAEALLRDASGRVHGVALRDVIDDRTREIQATVVIEACGAWSGRLSAPGDAAPPLRPLRGSHLLFPLERLDLRYAVSFLHPRDRRPVFVYPWLGAALLGTTDLDHAAGPADVRPERAEIEYLMEALEHQFPRSGLRAADALSIYAGVRPVVAGGRDSPSSESRESALWSGPGIVHVTGGKLTTFGRTAIEVLHRAAGVLPQLRGSSPASAARGYGVYGGTQVPPHDDSYAAHDATPVVDSPYRWGDLRAALRSEQVVHLDDLLLRRTRLGLLLPQGGEGVFERLRPLCAAELGWDDATWDAEAARYRSLWRRLHAPPDG